MYKKYNYQIKVNNKIDNSWDVMYTKADSDEEAIDAVKRFLCLQYLDSHYEVDNDNPIYSKEVVCESSCECDTMTQESANKNKGETHMSFFNVNWNNYTDQLSRITAEETWSNGTYPNNGILANYIVKTYNKLQSERNVIFSQDYALFNTGLFTKYYESIYAYQSGSEISFFTEYELSSIGVTERPERANYFEEPELLLFDWHYPIDIQYKHILDDERNRSRLPRKFLNSDNMVTVLNGAIDTMKKRVSCNYKLAVPQYYDGKIQLLLPLCLLSDTEPDVTIAVSRKDNSYQGHTCLTLDMAYNNARLIAKPESNWLTI